MGSTSHCEAFSPVNWNSVPIWSQVTGATWDCSIQKGWKAFSWGLKMVLMSGSRGDLFTGHFSDQIDVWLFMGKCKQKSTHTRSQWDTNDIWKEHSTKSVLANQRIYWECFQVYGQRVTYKVDDLKRATCQKFLLQYRVSLYCMAV